MNKKFLKIIILLTIMMMIIIPIKATTTDKYMLGDINCDHEINSMDLLCAMRHFTESSNNEHKEWILTGERFKLADINQDGIINSRDILHIQKYIIANSSPEAREKHPEWLKTKEIEVALENLQETEVKKVELKDMIEIQEGETVKAAADNSTNNTEATEVKLNQTEMTITKGQKAKLSATVLPTNVLEKEVEWVNDKQSVIAIEKEIPNDTYYIKSALDENKLIDIYYASKDNGAKVQIWNRNETVAQKFEIISAGDGYYYIKAKCSGKVLDVPNASKIKGTKIQQWPLNKSDAQKWEFEYAGNDYYYIKSKCNGLYLDVTGGKTESETPIEVWTENLTKAQKFKLERVNKKENENVENVTIKGKKAGTATITVKTKNGEKATCKVKVSPINFKSKVVFYSPHQDDETLYFGQTVLEAIKARGADNVYIVLISDGGASQVQKNSDVKELLTEMGITFSKARDNEFVVACNALGVKNVYFAENIGVARQADAGVIAKNTKRVMEYFENKFKGDVTHITYSYNKDFETHKDHKATGQALKELYDTNKNNSSFSSVFFIIKALGGKIYSVPSSKLITLTEKKTSNSSEYLKLYNALKVYGEVEKNEGRIGIGYRSVGTEMDRLMEAIKDDNKSVTTQIHIPY